MQNNTYITKRMPNFKTYLQQLLLKYSTVTDFFVIAKFTFIYKHSVLAFILGNYKYLDSIYSCKLPQWYTIQK